MWSSIKHNSGNVERNGRNWRILYYTFTTVFFCVVYLICRILGSAVLVAVLSFKWWSSFIVYTLSVLGLFCYFRGTLLLPSSGLLNLVQVNAEVNGCKKILQLCRKFGGNSGQYAVSTVEVGIFLSEWELRIPKQPLSVPNPVGDVKLIWPLGVGQWPVMLFGSKVR